MKIGGGMVAAALAPMFVAWLIGAAFAQSKQREGAPRAVINNMTINAGNVIEGTTYQNTFKIKNAGNVDLQIFSVRPG
jgi:hypothetical protein